VQAFGNAAPASGNATAFLRGFAMTERESVLQLRQDMRDAEKAWREAENAAHVAKNSFDRAKRRFDDLEARLGVYRVRALVGAASQ
jgi:hypothetical protein